MPRFDQKSYVNPLTNQQVADISITCWRATAIRICGSRPRTQQSRDGGPVPLLAKAQPYLVPGGVAVLVVLLLLLLAWRRVCRRRSEGRLSFYEASIAAAAIGAGCRTLYSEDMSHGQILEDGLTITSLFRAPRP